MAMMRDLALARASLVLTLRLTVLAEQRNTVAVHGPNSVLHRRRSDFGQYLLLLDVEQNDGC